MYTRTINLDGPAGNAFNLLTTAKQMAKDSHPEMAEASPKVVTIS